MRKKELVETLLFSPTDEKSAIFKKHKLRGQLTTTGFYQMQQFGLFLRERYIYKYNLLPKISSNYNVSKGSIEEENENNFQYNYQEDKENYKLTDLFYVRSTSFPRTIQSAQAVLIGLFSSSLHPWWMTLNRKLLNVDILTPLQENLLPNYSNCKRLEYYHRIIYNKVDQYIISMKNNLNNRENNNQSAIDLNNNTPNSNSNSTIIKSNNNINNNNNTNNEKNNEKISTIIFSEFRPTSINFSIDELEATTRKIFNINEFDRIRWIEINEKLSCKLHHNLFLDSQATPLYIEQVKRYTTWKFTQLYFHPALCRLAIGSFIGEIVDKLKLGIFINENGDKLKSPKLELFVGHDSTLIPLLCSFKLFNGNWPDYGSSLIIELWDNGEKEKNNEKYSIKFIINQQKEVTIPFNQFELLTNPLIPDDYVTECS